MSSRQVSDEEDRQEREVLSTGRCLLGLDGSWCKRAGTNSGTYDGWAKFKPQLPPTCLANEEIHTVVVVK